MISRDNGCERESKDRDKKREGSKITLLPLPLSLTPVREGDSINNKEEYRRGNKERRKGRGI